MNLINKVLLSLFIFNLTVEIYAQTPGMIFENRGIVVLDPNQDGFISKTTAGFTTADKFTSRQSEIPYVPFAVIQSEPTSDPGPGPNCFFNDFDDIREYGEPMYSYFDNITSGGPYFLFRYRLSGYAPNSKSYSVFIDIDQKFGFTGPNADPNAVSGNPGFEIEIYMASNFGVGIYNIDGLTAAALGSDAANIDAKDGTYPYTSYCHKAVAWPYPGGACDAAGTEYFYDFYIPYAAVTALTFAGQTATNIGGAHVTASTPFRMVGATVMNPNPGFGNNALSDFGGVDDSQYGNFDELWTDMITVFPPTSPDDISTGTRITPRSDCPQIYTPSAGATKITGTSTEDNGTNITVYVSANSSFSPATTYTTTVTSGAWSVTVPALTVNYYVKATAQNPNELYGSVSISESTSYDNCDIEQVTASCVDNRTPIVTGVTVISGNKGYTGSIANPTGATIQITLYTDAGAIYSPLTSSGNPVTTTTTTWSLSNGTGQSVTAGIYYIVAQDLTNGKCVSQKVYICANDNSGDFKNNATAPTITSYPVGTGVTLSGGGSYANTMQYIYINDIFIGTTTSTTTTWSYAGVTIKNCDVIKVNQYKTNTVKECLSPYATVTVANVAAVAPVITGSYCVPAAGSAIYVTGTSTEADGATVKIYKTGTVQIGTATVNNGFWATTTTGTVVPGNTIWATAENTTLSCVRTVSANSASLTIGTTTSTTGLSINATQEGAVSVSGVAPSTAGTYTIKIYVDGSNEYFNGTTMVSFNTATGIAAGAAWTINGIPANVLYAGAIIQASATSGTNCESSPTANIEVSCNPTVVLKNKVSAAVNSPICSGTRGLISVANSQTGVFYQLYDVGSGTDVGLTASGNGGTIYFQTPVLTNPGTSSKTYKIKAIRMVPTVAPCYVYLDSDGNGDDLVTVNVLVDLGPTDLTITTTPSPVNICSGQTFVAHVANSQATVTYQLFNNSTGVAISSPVLSAGENPLNITSNAITGSGNIPVVVKATSGVCTSVLSQVITVYLKPSPAATASNNSPICQGGTLTLTGGASGAASYAWTGPDSYSNSTQSPTVSTNATTSMSGSYTITVTGTNGCTSTASTTASVVAYPSITGTTPGSRCGTGTVSLAATASSGTLNWYDASSGGNLIGTGSPVTTPSISSTTPYWVEAVDNGCVSASRTEVVATVTSAPTASVLSGTNTICNGSSTNLSVAITGGTSPYSVTIDNGVGTINNYTSGSGISVSPGSTTTYGLTTVTDANSCSSSGLSGTPTVTVNNGPTASVLAGTASICNGFSTNLTVTITGGASPYDVTIDNSVGTINNYTSGSNISVSPSSTTTYSVTSVSDNNGCSSSGLSGTPTVTVNSIPTATISATTPICTGVGTSLSITLTGTANWQVKYSDGTTTFTESNIASSPHTINVNPGSTTTYTITEVSDTNCINTAP